MKRRLVLDAAAFDVLDSRSGRALRDVMRYVLGRGGDVRCAAVTLAEVARGPGRTRQVDVALARDRGGRRIKVMDTDVRVAKLVGSILHASSAGSEHIADAHVVAACAGAETVMVITSDPDDITRLGEALPGTRVVVRDPRL